MWIVCHVVDNDIRNPRFYCSREEALRVTNSHISSLIEFANDSGFSHDLKIYNGGNEFSLTANSRVYTWKIFKCDVKVV